MFWFANFAPAGRARWRMRGGGPCGVAEVEEVLRLASCAAAALGAERSGGMLVDFSLLDF